MLRTCSRMDEMSSMEGGAADVGARADAGAIEWLRGPPPPPPPAVLPSPRWPPKTKPDSIDLPPVGPGGRLAVAELAVVEDEPGRPDTLCCPRVPAAASASASGWLADGDGLPGGCAVAWAAGPAFEAALSDSAEQSTNMQSSERRLVRAPNAITVIGTGVQLDAQDKDTNQKIGVNTLLLLF